VPGALPRVLRVLIHYHAADDHRAQHVYLGEARRLRSDLDAAQ
jgi:chorismate mutase